jgi:hypothetical protein
MSVTHVTASATTPTPEAGIILVRDHVTQFTLGYGRLVNGLMQAMLTQIDIGRGLMEASVEDFTLLAAARTPDALVQAELEVFRRRSACAIDVAQHLTAQLTRTLSDPASASKSPAEEPGVAPAEPAQVPAKSSKAA